MKKRRICLVLLTTMAAALAAQAGDDNDGGATSVGNGGGAWVCQEKDSYSIRWIKQVDLWEASNVLGQTIPEYKGSSREILDQVMDRIKSVDEDLYNELAARLHGLNYLEENRPKIFHTTGEVTRIKDAYFKASPHPSECTGGILLKKEDGTELVPCGQIVNYQDDGTIAVQENLLHALSELDRAALNLHEVIYAHRREAHGDRMSDVARQIVGYVFSNLPVGELKKKLEALGEYGIGLGLIRPFA